MNTKPNQRPRNVIADEMAITLLAHHVQIVSILRALREAGYDVDYDHFADDDGNDYSYCRLNRADKYHSLHKRNVPLTPEFLK